MNVVLIDEWQNCYDSGWGDLIVPAAYSHPAKMSRSLVFKIIKHALEEGWLQPGQTVLDPFGGVGTTALPSLLAGLNYIGVELEPKFVELGRQNIDLWNSRFGGMPKWTGRAQLLQGDSRRLVEVVGAAGCVVGSPPFGNQNACNDPNYQTGRTTNGGPLYGDYGQTTGQLATLPPGTPPAIISSPPFAGNSGGRGEASRNGIDAALFDRHSGGMIGGMGDEPGNLGNLPMGSVGAVIGSPPYAESLKPETEEQTERKQARIAKSKSLYDGRNPESPSAGKAGLGGSYGSAPGQMGAMAVGSPPFADSVGSDDPDKRGGILVSDPKRRNDTNMTGTYGETDGQLGAMKGGVAVVGSPPFENSIAGGTQDKGIIGQMKRGENKTNGGIVGQSIFTNYGSTAGQIGSTQGDTFWAAARIILLQCYDILPPNAHAIWVVKGYIKGGKYVDFPGQWQALCEACGFETVHIHRAMLVKENGAQGNMFGPNKKNKIQRKSFFRILFETKQKGARHWLTLSRADKAAVLWQAKNETWRDYWISLTLFKLSDEDKEKAGIGLDMAAPIRPTRKEILGHAKMVAWVRDGKIDYEIETSIDFETVLCTRKRAA